MIGFVFLGFVVVVVVWMRRLAQGATGGWVMPDLVFKGFLCVSSHYWIPLRVSSLVV